MRALHRLSFCAAILMLGAVTTIANAQGLLRRIFHRPRVVCEPQPRCVPQLVPVETTLEGRVAFAGPMPKVKVPPPGAMVFADPTWRIDNKTKGVANICVYLKRPAGGKLPIRPEDRSRLSTITIDTPELAFVPHMVAYFPVWNDGKERGETGQRILLRNSSTNGHNIRLTAHPKYNEGFYQYLAPGAEFDIGDKPRKVQPQPLPLVLQDNIYTHMEGYIWVFDHPYYAITKADGTFTIPRVPVGMEVQVMAWHESQGWLFTKEGKTMTLKEGKNVLDFTIKAP